MKIPLSEIQRMIEDAENKVIKLQKHYSEISPDIIDSYNNLIWHLKQIERDLNL